MSISIKEKQEDSEAFSVTRRIFVFFVVLSILTLIYINTTNAADVKLLLDGFLEIELGNHTRRAILAGYKMAASLGLVFAYIILVGPFAYLSYFGEHIRPKKGKIINAISFFDLGLLLAIWFTICVASLRFVIINAVTKTPVTFIKNEPLIGICILLFILWLIAGFMKIYSYPREKRKELARYAIRF